MKKLLILVLLAACAVSVVAQPMSGIVPRYLPGHPNGIDSDTLQIQDAINAAAITGRPVFVYPRTVYNPALLTNLTGVVLQSWVTPGTETIVGSHEADSYTANGTLGPNGEGFSSPGWFLTTSTTNGGLNVHAFGATGNNSTDDSDAIQSAIDHAGEGSTIYLPSGIYYCSKPIHIGRYQRLVGEGAKTSTNATTTLRFSGNGLMHDQSDDDYDYPMLENICLYGDGTGVGITFAASHQIRMQRVDVRNFDIGLILTNCWEMKLDQVHLDYNVTAGAAMDNLVTDVTFDTCTIDHNGDGVIFRTAYPQNIQTIRFLNCSIQYNSNYGLNLDGGIETWVTSSHFEGNRVGDVIAGSSSNLCENLTMIGNHLEWSDNQANVWTNNYGPYQIDLVHASHVVSNDGHYLNGLTKNRTCAVNVSTNCEDISLFGKSSTLAPYAISSIKLNRTNPGLNLIANGLMNRDERNPNNYPWLWIADNVGTINNSSTNYPWMLGNTFSLGIETNKSMYPNYTNSLELGSFYTFTTLLRANAGVTTLIDLRGRTNTSGTDTLNTITNDGTYHWIVCRYNCDSVAKQDPFILYRNVESTTNIFEVGEVSLVKGYGVGGVSFSDAYSGGNDGKFPLYSSNIPNQGSWFKGQIIWNQSPNMTNPVTGWICLTNGSPGTWVPFGKVGFSSIWDDGNGHVGINTNETTTALSVWTTTGYDGIRIDGPSFPRLTLGSFGADRGYLGPITTAGQIFSDSLLGDITLRSQNDRILLGGSGGGASRLQINSAAGTNGITGSLGVSGSLTAAFVKPDNTTASTLIQTDGTKNLVSIANSTGWLQNNGSGNFSWSNPVLVDSSDTGGSFLIDKLVPGSNITFTTNNVGGVESLTITSSATGGSGPTNLNFQVPLQIVDTNVSLQLNGIANSYLRQSLGKSIIGRSASSVGNVNDISASGAGQVLSDDGSTLAFRQIVITNYAIAAGSGVTVVTNDSSTNRTFTLSTPTYAVTNYAVAAGLGTTVTTNVSGTNVTWTVSATGTNTLSADLVDFYSSGDADFQLTNSSAVVDFWAATGVPYEIDLPSAGTYIVSATMQFNVYQKVNSGWTLTAEFYDTTLGNVTGTARTFGEEDTFPDHTTTYQTLPLVLRAKITTSAPTTIQVWASLAAVPNVDTEYTSAFVKHQQSTIDYLRIQ